MGKLRTQDTPVQGRNSTVRISLLRKGFRDTPVRQQVAVVAHTATVTVDDVTPTNTYALVLTVNATTTTYSTVAVAGDSRRAVATRLFNLVNGGRVARAVQLKQVMGGDWEFTIVNDVTFAIANTGTTLAGELDVSVVTAAGAAPVAGATSITLAAPLMGIISAGQFLRFEAQNGTEVLVEIAETTTATASTISVAPLAEAIPVGSVADFPPEFTGRTAAAISRSFEITGFSTFNTGGFEDGVFTSSSAEADLSGLYYEFDPAYNTIEKFSPEGREFFLSLELESARDGWTGRMLEAVVAISSSETPANVEGFLESSFQAKVLTKPIIIPAQKI